MFTKPVAVLTILLLFPFSTFLDALGQSEFDSESMGLPMPEITMTPTSGQPGTEVEILVTGMAALPENLDPRIEFFIYIPFLSSVGGNAPKTCGGESCFALYSFDEVREVKFAPKTITFRLFSETNPEPVVKAGWMESVCDLKINDQTIERYGKLCSDQDQPAGDYKIKFGWGIQQSGHYDVRETLTFVVTEKEFVPEEKQLEGEELIFYQFEKGLITELEFEKRLAELGYDPEEVRQAKALLGMLEHQVGIKTPLKGPIAVQGTDYELTYTITGGVMKQVSPEPDAKSLLINIDSISNGTLFINLPRDVIDAKFGDDDDDFFVIIDGLETNFDETKSANDRTLTIPFPNGSEEIEIIGTFVVPEFGTIVLLILVVSISSIIAISRTKFAFLKI